MSRNARLARSETICACSGEASTSDDRMILCELCDVWYHFVCINMRVVRAEELELFICSPCEQKTGIRSIRFWEGIDTRAYMQNASRANSSMKSRRLGQPKTITDSDLESDESGSGFSETSDEKYGSDSSDMGENEARSSSQRASTIKTTRDLTLKRKTVTVLRPSKRPKPNRLEDVPDGAADPARSYCLAQLETVLRPIFAEHSFPAPVEPEVASPRASQYAKQVEIHLFEHFAEPDRSGIMAVGHKYKTQFRMLTFNLEKPDRQSLRRRIGQGELPASELSGMSNADLASEQQKKEMENAHQESLQHTILDAYSIDRPLRKITHKGEEEIEDVSKEDKESSAWSSRLTDSVPHDGSRRVAASSSVEISTRDTSLGSLGAKPDADSSTIDNASEHYTELQLLSLPLCVEDNQGGDRVSNDAVPNRSHVHPSSSPPPSMVPFNVNAITWSPQNDDIDLPGAGSPLTRSVDEGAIGLDIGSDAHSVDHDFNELLELDRPVQQLTEPIRSPNPVWKGQLRMPSTLGRPTIANVHSHLVAGRPIEFEDPIFWANLFRSDSLTIEGRVPVLASESYLLNSRLNSGRELVAVSFTALGGVDRQSYEEICDGLLAKGRHAVVFPWGNPPSADAPGKELYLVPLRPTDKPGYLDMLEHLSLPVARSDILMVGIFILHKAKRTPFTPPLQPTPTYSTAPGPSSAPPPAQSPSSLGFDISALTPEFIADILRNNPGIGTAAFAESPTTDSYALGASPHPHGASFPSSQVNLRGSVYRGSNSNRESVARQHTGRRTGSYDRASRGRVGADPGRVGQRDRTFDHR